MMQAIRQFVRISPRDSRYLELDDGSPFIPIGCNICWPGRTDDALRRGLHYLDQLAGHGANFARLWLSSSGLDIESAAGVYDGPAMDRIRRLVDHARSLGIRLKMTLEHFRYLLPEKDKTHQLRSDVFARKIYHRSHGGPLDSMQQYIDSDAGHRLMLDKMDFFARHFADDPAIFGWELWNEMNCVHADGWDHWTQRMLGELRARFPKHLVMQSLGSLDSDGQFDSYKALSRVAGQDVAQVHRYLDEGAAWKICHGPVDVSVMEAMQRLRELYPRMPLLLAESGAVEPHHAGPWRHARDDTDGSVLHDVIFGGFFGGGCGVGQNWHWDSYIDPNGLWWQYARAVTALSGIDPPAERFEPFRLEAGDQRVRAWGLRGRTTTLIWVRDARCDWRSEFLQKQPPTDLQDVLIRLPFPAAATARCYDPWSDAWATSQPAGDGLTLPSFKRSVIIRIECPQPETP